MYENIYKGAWIADVADHDQWLMVELERVHRIFAIATRGETLLYIEQKIVMCLETATCRLE